VSSVEVSPRHPQILGLDLIRFGAALLVAALHIGARIPAAEPLTWFGWVGVQIFFVLSGFVIAYSAQGASPRAFFSSRFARLAPGVLVCASLTALVYLAIAPGSGATLGPEYLRTLMLWPSGSWLDSVYWTLPIEIAFYSVVLIAMIVAGDRAFEPLLIGIGSISALFALARGLLEAWPALPFAGAMGAVDPQTSRMLLLDYGCDFAVGGLLWLCLARGFQPLRTLALTVFLVAAAAEVAFESHGFDHIRSAATPVMVFLAAVALMAISQIRAARDRIRFARQAGAVRIVGLMTFPIYLLHDNIGRVVFDAAAARAGQLAAALASAVVVLASSFVIAVLIEPPMRGGIRRALAPGVARA